MSPEETTRLLGDCSTAIRVWDLDMGKFNITEGLIARCVTHYSQIMDALKSSNDDEDVKRFANYTILSCAALSHRMSLMDSLESLHLGISRKLCCVSGFLKIAISGYNKLVKTRVQYAQESEKLEKEISALKEKINTDQAEIASLTAESEASAQVLADLKDVKFNTPGSSSDAYKVDIVDRTAATLTGAEMLAAAEEELELKRAELNSIESHKEELEKSKEACKKLNSDLEDEIVRLNSEISSKKERMDQLETEKSEVNVEISKREYDLKKREEKLRTVTGTLLEKGKELSSEKEKLEKIQKELDSLEGEEGVKSKRLQKAKDAIEITRKDLAAHQSELTDLRAEDLKLSKELKKLTDRVSRKKRSVKNRESTLIDLEKAKKDRETAEAEFKKLEEERKKLLSATASVRSELSRLKLDQVKQQNELRESKVKLSQVETGYKNILSQITATQEQIRAREATWESLKKNIRPKIEAKDIINSLIPNLGIELAGKLCNSRILIDALHSMCSRGIVELPSGKLKLGKVRHYLRRYPAARQVALAEEEGDSSSSSEYDESSEEEDNPVSTPAAAASEKGEESDHSFIEEVPADENGNEEEKKKNDKENDPEEPMDTDAASLAVEDPITPVLGESSLIESFDSTEAFLGSDIVSSLADLSADINRSARNVRPILDQLSEKRVAPIKKSLPLKNIEKSESGNNSRPGTFDFLGIGVPASTENRQIPETRGAKRHSAEQREGDYSGRQRINWPEGGYMPTKRSEPECIDLSQESPDDEIKIFERTGPPLKRRQGYNFCCGKLPIGPKDAGLSHIFPQDQRSISRQRQQIKGDREPYLMYVQSTEHPWNRRFDGFPPEVTEDGVVGAMKVSRGPPTPTRKHILILDFGYLSGLLAAKTERTRHFYREKENWKMLHQLSGTQDFRRTFAFYERDHALVLWHMSIKGKSFIPINYLADINSCSTCLFTYLHICFLCMHHIYVFPCDFDPFSLGRNLPCDFLVPEIIRNPD